MNEKAELPRRSDSYEKQLSDGELLQLHAGLLARRLSLEQIRDGSPVWRSGPNMGKSPSIATLHNIRDRLEMQADLEEDEATAISLIDQVRADLPDITQAQLDDIGQRTFTLLALRKRDPDRWLALKSARDKAELEKQKLALRDRAENRHDGKLALETKKFQRETCELWLKWSEDQRAKDIASSPVTNSEKIEMLGQLMFGEDWKA